MKTQDYNQIAEEAKLWLESQAGQDKLNHAAKEVNYMSSELQKACVVKPETLNEPVTL